MPTPEFWDQLSDGRRGFYVTYLAITALWFLGFLIGEWSQELWISPGIVLLFALAGTWWTSRMSKTDTIIIFTLISLIALGGIYFDWIGLTFQNLQFSA